MWDGAAGPDHWLAELAWRDFYRHIAHAFPRVVKGGAFRPDTDRITWDDDRARQMILLCVLGVPRETSNNPCGHPRLLPDYLRVCDTTATLDYNRRRAFPEKAYVSPTVIVTGTLGGVGLFLLGMWLLTEALRLGGGNTIERLLSSWSHSRPRAFFSGFAVTAVVQASSVVIISVIGFVNAGLLSLSQSVWLVFGSNVGTTMTSWIVAFIGLRVDIDLFALPAIGMGAALRLFSHRTAAQSLGGALAGLGLVFLGLQLLQDTFGGLGQLISLDWAQSAGWRTTLLMMLTGLLLTVLMQSSSAAIAIVLTSVAAGIVPLIAGAAAVIGANIGTTVTALIAVLRATSNARRVALAHVLFNAVTALAGLLLLSQLLNVVAFIERLADISAAPAISLALFHTVFNLLGILLMIPLEPSMLRLLRACFRSREEEMARLQYLDSNSAQIPDLAVRALYMEEQRTLRLLGETMNRFLQRRSGETGDADQQALAALEKLLSGINDFTAVSSGQSLPDDAAGAMQATIQINVHMAIAMENLRETEELLRSRAQFPPRINNAVERLTAHVEVFRSLAGKLPDTAAEEVTQALVMLEEDYRAARTALIEAGRLGIIDMRRMETITRLLSMQKRAIKQYGKAVAGIVALSASLGGKHTEPAAPDAA